MRIKTVIRYFGVMSLQLALFSAICFAQGKQQQTQPVPSTISNNELDDNEAIRRNRMGMITVQTIPGAMVRVEQQRHEFWFGSSITSSAFNGRLSSRDSALFRETFLANFNSGVTENALKWQNSEPKRGQINFEVVDKTLAWADANRIPLRGHNIYWGIKQFVPDWVRQLDSTSLRLALEKRGREVASRYRDRFAEYDLNNEMIHGNIFSERLGPKITLEMANWVRSEDPSAKLYLNDYNITTGKKLNLYMDHIRDLLAMGVPISGIGAQGHLHGQTFDRAALRNSLDQLAKFNLPIRITEFNIPGQTSKFYDHREITITADEELEKARELTDFLRICFAHPGIEGFFFWGFWEGANWIPQSSLYRRDWTPTPAGLAYRELVFNKWWTNWEGKADKNGKCEVPAFFGTHRVTIGNRSLTVELLKKEGSATVTMVPSGTDLLEKGLGAWVP